MPIEILMGPHLFVPWSLVAIEQEKAAIRARRTLARAMETDGSPEAMNDETRASLVAIVSSAHAFYALAGEIGPIAAPKIWNEAVVRASEKRKKVWLDTKRATKVLRRATVTDFDPRAERLTWLFDEMRVPAVHHVFEMAAPQEHPLGFHTSWMSVVYACENATKAVDLLMNALRAISDEPAPGVVEWASNMRHAIEPVLEAR